jgi:hypothetical protein
MSRRPRPGRKPSERRWARGGLPPELEQILASCPPSVRQAALTGADVLYSRKLAKAFSWSSPFQRANLLDSFRHAVSGIVEGNRCDHCTATAKAIRFVAVPPKRIPPGMSADARAGLVAFLLLCDACNRRGEGELEHQTLVKVRDLIPGHHFRPHRPAVLGALIGGQKDLAPRTVPQTCGVCGRPIWANQDDASQYTASDGDPFYLCLECAKRWHDEKRLRLVWRV